MRDLLKEIRTLIVKECRGKPTNRESILYKVFMLASEEMPASTEDRVSRVIETTRQRDVPFPPHPTRRELRGGGRQRRENPYLTLPEI